METALIVYLQIMKAVSTLLCILLTTYAFSQPIIAKNDAVQVIYIGAENPITVRVNNYHPWELTAKPGIGRVWKVNNKGSYIWKICESRSSSASVNIYCGKQFLKKVRFPLRKTPSDPLVDTDGRRGEGGGSLTGATGLSAGFPDFTMPDMRCTIISFHIVRIRNINVQHEAFRDTLVSEAFNLGPLFNEHTKQLIDKSEPGDFIMIDKIFAKVGCEPKPRELAPRIYNIY